VSKIRTDYARRDDISDKLRWAVKQRDNFTCVYCGYNKKRGEKEGSWGGLNWLEIDHVRPFSKKGKATLKNLVQACHKCNVGKSDSILIKGLGFFGWAKKKEKFLKKLIKHLQRLKKLEQQYHTLNYKGNTNDRK
jgi:hypothetical protein